MAPLQNTHPLPAPPGQQNSAYQQPAYQSAQNPQRPISKGRRSRGFSFRSEHSSGSKDNKEQLIETHREKEAKRLHTKADPTMALNEIEPGMMFTPVNCLSLLNWLILGAGVVAAQAQQTMDSLRAMQHTDLAGNVISKSPTSFVYREGGRTRL